MGLRDYLRVAKRHWWLLVGSVVVALGVALVVNVRTTPVHAARVTFFFTAPMAEAAELYPGSMFSSGRLATYAELLTSEEIEVPLAAVPGVNLSPDLIGDRISAETIADTVLMEVTVEDTSPDRGMLLAQKLAVLFKATVENLETQPGGEPVIRVEVVDGPRMMPDPVAPRPVDNYALALMAGLIVGAGSAVVREISDHTVRSADSLRELAAVPVLARVPEDARAPSVSGPFVSPGTSARTEALRQVRTLLQSAAAGSSLKTLAVTSAVPREGRSAIVCSLALLFAETGQRVLVVDAELRRPRLGRFLGLDGQTGLSNVLNGSANLDQAIQPWGVGLWLLAGGTPPPNPSELLSSPRMTEVVDEVRRRFDVVIFDCPPLLPVTDGEVVAARADGTLLVVRSRRTTNNQVTAAVRALHAVNASLLGCVLNMVPRRDPDATPGFDEYTRPQPSEKRWWGRMSLEVAA
ncbi:polysaccharide biosynthesis tyrosine autokinase [Actinoplanes derwentensis]|uniref:Capsular exopolysaccharide family n=1 Tax=Actinoplanes derwentensis TaxID=113562 RepID=A0A1H1UWC0_9ACTN|nr:polysaccharide biosynthesis tyrosine autokinase [Actinoplanes derwentensis]GID88895.1 chromosome partitioning protein [Actinoplanes derwentensis]SDS76763.1 capsular exopolysaccharide family [Actinoplanes derwentensis]